MGKHKEPISKEIMQISIEGGTLEGELCTPENAKGVVLFAHGSGSSRHSPRNKSVANQLNQGGLATLLIDLLTAEEDLRDNLTVELRFDIWLLAKRLQIATDWLTLSSKTKALPLFYFGASTGAAAALVTAAENPTVVKAVVSRGGRPDLAKETLVDVKAPTLLIVGGADTQVIRLNEIALARMHVQRQLVVIPKAGHLFEEPGALEEVGRLALQWFNQTI
jgi:pimeloyl-ACP methyl ester carboxylesterase